MILLLNYFRVESSFGVYLIQLALETVKLILAVELHEFFELLNAPLLLLVASRVWTLSERFSFFDYRRE